MTRSVRLSSGVGSLFSSRAVRAAVNLGFHLGGRLRSGELAFADPVLEQERVLLGLVRKARSTRFGRDHDFGSIRSVADFQRAVPTRTYEMLWDEYLGAQLSGLRQRDVAGPHSVPGLDERDDPGRDQVHSGLGRNDRVQPQGRADDARGLSWLATRFEIVPRPGLLPGRIDQT